MPTMHLDRGNGGEVCRERPLPGRAALTTKDLAKVDCPVCKRVLTRCLLEGEDHYTWVPRCATCEDRLELHACIEDTLGGERRLLCLDCYCQRHPAYAKMYPVKTRDMVQ